MNTTLPHIQKNKDASTVGAAKSGSAAKTLPSPTPQIAAVQNLGDSQSPLQKISNITGAIEGNSFSAPSGGVFAPIQRAEVELKGEKSIGAKFNSFFFGQESTFTQLEKKYEQFKKEIKISDKEKYKNESIVLGNSWLNKHGNSKDANDLKKKQSIQSMLAGLLQAPVPQNAPEPGKAIEQPKVDPVLPIVASNFSMVRSTHDAYKSAKKGAYSPGELFAIFSSLSGFLQQLNLWDQKFATPQNPAFEIETVAVSEFRTVLNESFVCNAGPISGTVNGINIENLAKGIFTASSFDATLTLPNGTATGSLQQVQIKENRIEFSAASLGYSGNIGFDDIFQIGSPTLTISSNAIGYEIKGAGDLQLSLDNVSASGHVEIAYNSATRTFENPTFSNAQLEASLLSNSLHVTANNVNYAAGALSADSGTLQVDVMGTSMSGSVDNISYSKQNGLDWGSASFSSTAELSIDGIINVKDLSGTISGAADGYKKTGTGNLSLDLPGGSTVSGTVSVSSKDDTGWKVDSISNGTITATVLGNTLTIQEIQYANGIISATSGTMQLDIAGTIVNVSVQSISLGSDKKFNWESAAFNSPGEISIGGIVKVKDLEGTMSGAADGYEKSGTGTLSIDLPGSNATGTVAVSYQEGAGWKVDSIANASVTATVLGNILTVNDIQYSDGVISAQSGTMQLDIGGAKVDVSVSAISLGNDKKFNWGTAAFSSPNEFSVGGVVKAKGLAGTVSGEADGFKKTAVGTLILDIPGATATGTVSVAFEEGKGWKVDSITDGGITATLLNGNLEINGNNISYENNVLSIGEAVATVSTGGGIPGVDKVSGTAQNITYKDGKYDWESITLNINAGLSLGDQLSFGLGTATLFGKNKGYNIDINDATGNIVIGSWLTGTGTGSFSWDFMNNQSPEITSASLQFLATSPELPKDLLPGLLPISFSVSIPFAAGPVPMEAGLSLNVDAGAKVNIGGKMDYAGGEFAFGLNAGGNGHLTMGVRASLAVGSSALVSLGAFLEGSTKANLEAGVEFNGKAAKQGVGYNFSDINANYKLGANVIAQLSGGVEAKALLVFSKTLYKVNIKSWDMGRAEKMGTFNFSDGKFTSTASSGVLEAGSPNLGKPVAEHQSLPFVQSMEAVSAAIDSAKKIASKASTIVNGLDAGAVDKSNAELLKAKNEVMGLLRDSIAVTLRDPEFTKLSNKLLHYNEKLIKIKNDNTIWEAELENKKTKPPVWHITAIRGTPEEVYSRKIAEGKLKQGKYLARNENKKVNIESQLSIFQKQLDISSNMIQNIDQLLDPMNEIDAIQEKVVNFNTFNSELDTLHAEIERENAAESAEQELDRIESAYISQDLNEKA